MELGIPAPSNAVVVFFDMKTNHIKYSGHASCKSVLLCDCLSVY